MYLMTACCLASLVLLTNCIVYTFLKINLCTRTWKRVCVCVCMCAFV
jgi:hypothetical protein